MDGGCNNITTFLFCFFLTPPYVYHGGPGTSLILLMTSNYNRSSFLQNNNCQRLKLVRPRIFYGSNLYSCSCTVRLSDGVLFPSLVLHFHVPPLDYNLNTTLTLTVLQHMLGQKYFFLDPKDL